MKRLIFVAVLVFCIIAQGVSATSVNITWDSSNSSSALTYTDLLGNPIARPDVANLSPWKDIWPGTLNLTNGTFSPAPLQNGTGMITTDPANPVMVRIPTNVYWYTTNLSPTRYLWSISTTNDTGYELVYAANQRGGVGRSHIYVGAYLASSTTPGVGAENSTTKISSYSGQIPFTGANTTFTMTRAEANAANMTVGTSINASQVGIENFWTVNYIQMLYLMEYGSWYSQSLTSGIGRGVVDLPSGTGYAGLANGANSIDTRLNVWGTGNGTGTDGQTSIAYRFLHDWWGGVWRFNIGYNAPDAGKYRVINRNGTGTLAETLAAGSYEETASSKITTDGYWTNILYEPPVRFGFVPYNVTGGSAATYSTDYSYNSGSGTKILLVGGDWNSGSYAGVAARYSSITVGFSSRAIGARLEYIPAPKLITPIISVNSTSGYVPLTIQFNDTSVVGDTIEISRTLDYGDGTNITVLAGNSTNSTHTYTAAGIYNVNLTASNTFGTASNTSLMVNVSPTNIVTVDFTGTPTNGTAPLTVQFNSTGLNQTAWNWTFGDGSSTNATLQNPLHVYSSAGTYSVTLNVTDGYGTYNATTKSGYIIATAPSATLIANFTASNTTVSVGDTVTFTDTSTGIPGTWAWYFGDENWTAIGSNWTTLNSSSLLYPIQAAPMIVLNNGSILLTGGNYASGGTDYFNNITYISNDGGKIFTAINMSSGWSVRNGHSMALRSDGSVILIGGSFGNSSTVYNDVWVTSDSGKTWSVLNTSADFTPRALVGITHSTQNISIFGGFVNPLYTGVNDTWSTSSSDGSVWIRNGNASFESRDAFATATTPDGHTVVIGGIQSNGSIWRNNTWMSSNGGLSWTLANSSNPWGNRYNNIAVALPNNMIITGFGFNGTSYNNDTWYSVDYGATWIPLNLSVGFLGREAPSSVTLHDGTVLIGYGADVLTPRHMANDMHALVTASSNSQNPSHTYTTPGTYAVSLGVANSTTGTNATTKTAYITVTAPAVPITSFTANTTSGPVPLSVQFTDTSGNSPTSWAWTFGDGNTSTLQNPLHQYVAAGTYSVSLNATNTLGSNATTYTNYITVTAAGEVRHDITLSRGYNFTIYFLDATSHAALSDVTAQWTGAASGSQVVSISVNVTSNYGLLTVYAVKSGYYGATQTFLVDGTTSSGTMYLTQSPTVPSSISYTSPHTVTVFVRNVFGPVPNVNVSTYFVNSSGPTEWWNTWLGISTATNVTIDQMGITGDDGAVAFTMIATSQYRIEANVSGEIYSMTVFPASDEYTILVSGGSNNFLANSCDPNDIETIVTGTEINGTAGYINVTYNDITNGTYYVQVLVNRSVSSGNSTVETMIDNYTTTSPSFTHSFTVANHRDRTYLVHIRGNSSTCGQVKIS